MTPVPEASLRNKRVTVAGLGRFGGGIAVSQWLVREGARVLVTDQAKPDVLQDSVRQLDGLPIEFRLGEHREDDFARADLVVASPAMPPASPFLQAARSRDVPVTTEIRLFLERCVARVLGVTGTKGKSTTTALLGQMLKQKHATHVGGNIGKSLLFELPDIRRDDLVVLELSSFMLEYLAEAKWSPHVAVVTMIAADHLDRHGTKAAYVDAKLNLVRFQRHDDVAVLNETCPDLETFARATIARKVYFGIEARKPFDLKIPGWHNQLNAQAAFAAAELFDVSWDDAQRVVADFRGLPHRLELVHERDGVRYYNDSIATIPEAAVAALTSFPARTVIQIVGGYDKTLDMTSMCAALIERAKAVLCIGQTGPAIASVLEQSPKLGAAACYACGELATAMKVARDIAAPGDVVLLSTGCASYDQFRNFEERGNEFARLARSSD
jgi:UDP-N-acetylmuramoylalanine--D-glutamate ligase